MARGLARRGGEPVTRATRIREAILAAVSDGQAHWIVEFGEFTSTNSDTSALWYQLRRLEAQGRITVHHLVPGTGRSAVALPGVPPPVLPPRRCCECRNWYTGAARKTYCSNACVSRAWRRRKKAAGQDEDPQDPTTTEGNEP